MDNLIGYPLADALKIIEQKKKENNCNKEYENNIVNIKKIIGTNNKFNNLENPYVIRCSKQGSYITLCVSYY